jgi:hypothetical protein
VGQESSEDAAKSPESPKAGGASRVKPGRKGICALDLGAARVGVAVSDELGVMAHPRGALAAKPRPVL